MPTQDLPKNLESKAEALRRLENDCAKTNKNFENWGKALEAFALGWRPPKVYHPIVISPDSPVSSPQKLQDMAGMTTTPRVFTTTYTTMHGGLDAAHQTDGKPEEVQIGEVGWDELVKITEEAEFDDWLFVFVDGKVRMATMIKSFKKGDKHEGE